MVHRLPDIHRMVDNLRQRKVHPTVLAAGKLMKCDACQGSARLSLRPVLNGILVEPGAALQVDIFYWRHPTLKIHTKGTLWVDMASRVTVVRIWKTSPRTEWDTSHQWKQERCFQSVRWR